MKWIIVIAAATVAACTTTATSVHTWRAGDNVTDTFEQDKAKCSLLVDQRYAGYGVASTLLSIPAMEQTFDTCLQSLGWHEVKRETRERHIARCDAQLTQMRQALGKEIPQEVQEKLRPAIQACREGPLDEISAERAQ